MTQRVAKVGVVLLFVVGCTERVRSGGHAIAAEESLNAECHAVRSNRELLPRLQTLRDGWTCGPREEIDAECFFRKSSVMHEDRFHILVAAHEGKVTLRLATHRSFDLRISSLAEILHGARALAWVEDVDAFNTQRVDLGPVLEALGPCSVP